jgi:hypothetical protein
MSWNSVWGNTCDSRTNEHLLNLKPPKSMFDASNREFEQHWKQSCEKTMCDRSAGSIPVIKVEEAEEWSDVLKERDQSRNAFDRATDQHTVSFRQHLTQKSQETMTRTTVANAYAERFPNSMAVRVHDWETNEMHEGDQLGLYRDSRPALLEHENMRHESCNDNIMVREFETDREGYSVDCGVTYHNNASFI